VARGSLTAVRLTEFWRRMDEQFGAAYAQSVAKDYVLAGLGGRTIAQALAEGDDVKAIWRAVCAAFNVPERLR
jgi:tRNA A22 N-methylase